jgi:hypothetical protein
MADQKISQLNELTSPLSGDTLPIVNNGETKKVTVSNLFSLLPIASDEILGGIKVDGTTILIDENGVISASSGEQPSYRGFYVGVCRFYDEENSINQLIFSNSTTAPTYDNPSSDTDLDDFRAQGLDGDIVVMLNLYGSSQVVALDIIDLTTVAELFIDNVLYSGENAVTDASDAKTRFENNLSTIIAPVSSNLLADGLFQFFNYNNNFSIQGPTSGGTGSGFTIFNIQYNMLDDTLSQNGWDNGPGYTTGDTLTILGTDIRDGNNNALSSPSNDITVTINSVDGIGNVISFTLSGTLPRPAETWPTDYINDGYEDIYDSGNYINTDLGSDVPYFGGNVASGSDSSPYWGDGSEYVTVYDNSVWSMMAFNTSVTQVNYGGETGFDSDGIKESQALIGGGDTGVSIGNFVFNGNNVTITDTEGGVIKITSPDDLIFEALGDDVIIRSDDDIRLQPGYNFTDSEVRWTTILRDNGEMEFYNDDEGDTYGHIIPATINGNTTLTFESENEAFIKTNNGSKRWKFDTTGKITLPNSGSIVEGEITNNPTIELTPANPDVESQRLVIKGGAGFSNTENDITISVGNLTYIVGDTVNLQVYSLSNVSTTMYWWISGAPGSSIGTPEDGEVQIDEGGFGYFNFVLDNDQTPFTVYVSDTLFNAYQNNNGAVSLEVNSIPVDLYHLHLTTGDLTETSIILGTDSHNVRTMINGDVNLTSYDYNTQISSSLTFNKNGNLVLPNGGDIQDNSGNSVLSGSNTHPYFISTDTGSVENYKVGDNVWLGDNGTLNTLVVKGVSDSGSAYVKFGNAQNHQNPYIGHDSGEDANVLSVVADTTKFSNAIIVGSGSLVAGNPEMIHVYSSGSYNIANFIGNTETYSQINVKNINDTSGASSDIVVTANNGDEENHYVNLGINSSGWEFQTSSIGYQNDGYLYNVGQDMYVGVMEPSSPDHGHLHLFSEGLWQNPSINIVESGSVAFGTGSVSSGFNFEFSGSVKLQNDLQVNEFVVLSEVSGSLDFANDTAAEAGGVPLGGLYRNGNFVMIRLS